MAGVLPRDNRFTAGLRRFGTFLSSMVMPSLGAFLAWGVLAALFLPGGWFPNEHLGQLVRAILVYLLPLLIGYTGGRMVHGIRGGAIGALATMGVIAGANTTMVAGALLMGPLAAWLLKHLDRLLDGKAKPGFEMLLTNLSMGILGALITIAGYLGIGPVIQVMVAGLTVGVDWVVAHNLLPLLAIPVAPAQAFFSNNVINYAVMMPLGLEQVAQTGKSILFLVDPNPGPSVGTLLAIALFGKGVPKRTAPVAALIAGVGGIGEVYFPFVLARPILVFATMGGIATSLGLFSVLGGGTVATPSPGSVMVMLALSPQSALIPNLIGFLGGLAVSFLLGALLLRFGKAADGDDSSAVGVLSQLSSTTEPATHPVRRIVVACDAGMGSSAMGSSILRSRLREAGLDVEVRNTKIEAIPPGADIIVTHAQLSDRAKKLHDDHRVRFMTITNFMEGSQYDEIVAFVQQANQAGEVTSAEPLAELEPSLLSPQVLNPANVVVGAGFVSKEEAIRAAGQILVRQGYVLDGYLDSMQEREKVVSVYVGNHVAIPHGQRGSDDLILRSGVSVIQVPDGVAFGDDVAYVLFGIAGKGDEHLEILSRIASFCSDLDNVQRLRRAQTAEELLEML